MRPAGSGATLARRAARWGWHADGVKMGHRFSIFAAWLGVALLPLLDGGCERAAVGGPAATPAAEGGAAAAKAKAEARRAKAKARAKARGKTGAKARGKAGLGGEGGGRQGGPADRLAELGALGGPKIVRIEAMLRNRRMREALPVVREALGEDPDNVELHAAMMLICDHFGEYSCALSASTFAVGARLTPVDSLRAAADALRADGQGRAAAALRASAVWDLAGDQQLARIYALISRDLTEVGALDEAEAAMRMAESFAPDSADLQFYGVMNALSVGDLDEAEFRLWRGGLDGSFDGPAQAEAELAVAVASHDLLATNLKGGRPVRQHWSRVGLSALRSRARLLHDDADLAAETVERASYKIWGEIYHPELLLCEAAVRRAQGEPAAAAAALERLAHTAPRHPDWARWGEAAPR